MLMMVRQAQGDADVADVRVLLGRQLAEVPELAASAFEVLKRSRKTLLSNDFIDSGSFQNNGATFAWTLKRLVAASHGRSYDNTNYVLCVELA